MSELDILKQQSAYLAKQTHDLKESNTKGIQIGDYFFNKLITRIDPVEYCERILRDHLPEDKKHLHENQVEFVRAACDPRVRQVVALMARQCIVKGSVIHTRDGKLVRIEDHPNAWLTHNEANLLEVKVKDGHLIRCTNNHPIMTPNGWVNAGELQAGDHVVVLESWDKFGDGKIPYTPSEFSHVHQTDTFIMNDELAELMGWFASSEGIIQPNQSLMFTNVNMDYASHVGELVTRYFPDIKVKNHPTKYGFDYIFTDKSKNQLDSLNNLIRIMDYDEDKIPRAINYFTKDQVMAFFKGMFAVNGYATQTPREDKEYSMGFLCGDKRPYAEFYRELLNKLGIQGQVSTEFNEKANGYFYKITVTNQRSIRNLLAIIDKFPNNPDSNFIYLENKDIVETFKGEDGENLYISQVTSIKEVGTGEVWDVMYPNKGWFICGGIKVHNSGKTESIASICGYLLDNYPQMRIGIFTPRIQQAEMSVGRLAIFYQMNEEKLNNQLVKVTKQHVELSNGSYVSAVSGSDQSNIEGLTFDVIILDEAQKISNYTWSERIVPMGGACITGESLISLPSGELVPIKELVEKHEQTTILGVNEATGSIVEVSLENFVDTGVQQTLKITLDSGRTIQGTLDHPVIVKPRSIRKPTWAQFRSLEVGMQVAVPKALPYFGTFDNKDARLLGMLIGNGFYIDGHISSYDNEDNELRNYIKENYITPYHASISNDNKFFEEMIFTILKEAKVYGQIKTNKRLPINHNTYTKQALAELMGGLFDTNGNISIVNNSKVTISLTQLNLELIKEIQLVLLKLGIHGKIHTHTTIRDTLDLENAPYYVLQIRDKESVENFTKNIKFLIKHKQEKLEQGIEILATHKYKIQKNLIDSDLRFERITSIEDTGKAHVYDLTTEANSFIANGIYVHNTRAKLIKVGTPKTHNHFYESFAGKASSEWVRIRRDWTQCAQLWALGAIYLPNKDTGEISPYSEYVMSLMPKSLKQWYFPHNPEVWTDGEMSVEDFKTQYMLEFVTGAGVFLSDDDFESLTSGAHDFIDYGTPIDHYVGGIDFAGSSADGADFTHISILRITPNGQRQKVFAMEMQGADYNTQRIEIVNIFGGGHPRFKCDAIFADYTGCGRAIIDILMNEDGLRQIVPITFNASDTFLKSGMNLKNSMFDRLRVALANNMFKYPNKEIAATWGENKRYMYNKMLAEWRDLEFEIRTGINKIISAPSGQHDDVCCADVLANFGAEVGNKKQLPKPSFGRMRRW